MNEQSKLQVHLSQNYCIHGYLIICKAGFTRYEIFAGFNS